MEQFIAFIVFCVTLPFFIIICIFASFIGQTQPVIDGYESYICGISKNCDEEGEK